MREFLRAVRMSSRHRLAIFGIIVSSSLVALLWGANMSAVYPFVEAVFQNKSLHEWADDSIANSRRTCTEIESELDVLNSRLNAVEDPSEHRNIESEIKKQTARLDAEQDAMAVVQRVQPMIQRYMPDDPFQTLVVIVAFVMAGTVLKCLFLVTNLMLVQRISQLITLELRQQFFQQMLQMELGAFGEQRSSDLMSRVTGDIGCIGAGVAYLFGKLLREPLKMIVCLIGAIWINWRLLLFCMVICPLAFLLMYRLAGSIKRANRRAMEEMARLFGRLSQTLGGIQVVKAFTMERFERGRFKQTAREVYQKVMRITMYDSLTRCNNEVMGIAIVCIAIVAGGYLVQSGETEIFGIKMSDTAMDFGAMTLFYAFLIGISDPARKLADFVTTVQRGVAASERVFPLLDREPTIVDPPNPKSIKTDKPGLTFEGVSFHYIEDQPVLRDIDLEIQFGETLAIVGPNGCGKSTLVNLVPRFYDPCKGQIRIDDLDLRDVRRRELRRKIGVVTQQTILFDDTIMNNIRYGATHASDAEVIAAAKKAHAHRFIMDKLEDGYDTNVGEHGDRLSGGQRQRIALARAILRDPSILILDEATSQIDPESEQLIHTALQEFIQGRTAIMITHRLSTLDMADRILVLDQGRVADIGTHDQLIERCRLYRRLYDSTLKESA